MSAHARSGLSRHHPGDVMRDKHFFLTLPSNSSLRYFGKQLPNDYATKLEHTISLDPELWEVGLAQISYPKTWPNLPKTLLYVSYPNLENLPFPDPTPSEAQIRVACEFGGIKYVSPKHLVRDLQKTVRDNLPEKYRDAIRIRYDDVSHRAKLTIANLFGLWMHDPLAITLGLNSTVAHRTKYENKKGYFLPAPRIPNREMEHTTVSPLTVFVDRLTPTVFVYCDIVQQQIVGDGYVQLLRAIGVPETGGDMVTHKFSNIHYVNLQTGTFETVTISLKDSLGQPIDFKQGDVIVKLHFRRKER